MEFNITDELEMMNRLMFLIQTARNGTPEELRDTFNRLYKNHKGFKAL